MCELMSLDPHLIGWLQSPAEIAWWGIPACVVTACGGYAAWKGLSSGRPREPHPLEGECEQLRHLVQIRDWELGLTRRFLGTRDLSGRLNILLQALVADPQTGFAAVFRIVGDEAQPEQSIGLHPDSNRKLTLSTAFVRDTISQGSLATSSPELARHRHVVGFSTFERSRLVNLYSLRLGAVHKPWGLLISSELPAMPSGETASLTGWGHLTSILGEELASQESSDRQGNELALTREMFELRSLADKQYRSPAHLLQEFLRRLTEMTDFDRATLVLTEDEQQLCDVPLLRGGGPLARDIQLVWEHAEDRLLVDSSNISSSAIWSESDLKRLGVHGPFAMAVTLPLIHHDWAMGQLCLTRRLTTPVSESHRKLLSWGAKFLVELVARTIDRAAIELQAKRDGLTQLANRHAFDMELDRIIDRANRVGDELSLILLDLDHFKAVNDTHGHLGGDAALKTVARVVERSVQAMRDGDQPLVARYGGEELVVLLPGVGEAGSRRIAESIREAVMRTPIPFEGREFHLTLSAGVATRCETVSTSRALISAADAALYRAKANGRNRVEVTSESAGATVPAAETP